ncbi:MAG: AAA family ATPase [Thiovulaceae bacterium]|nr:AAA family ATPase [Sulfurimonadaceae bacterium]
MQFQVLDILPNLATSNTVYLINDNWDDWFEFGTLYILHYYDSNNVRHHIGQIKIGQFNMVEKQRRAAIPPTFEVLMDAFFSVGQDTSYYSHLNNLDDEIGNEILRALRDFAFDLELFERAQKERVTRISLLRDVSSQEVRGQFHRIAHGGAIRTPYDFQFFPPKPRNSDLHMELSFNVEPTSNPPTNVHVLIGRNGVGKTHLLSNMLNALFSSERTTKHGVFVSDEEILFANVVSVSFSAFDESEPRMDQKDRTKGLKYSYIGLKKVKVNDEKDSLPKSPTVLKNEFVKSLENCKLGNRKERWINAVTTLESDPMFKESEILQLIEIEDKQQFKDEASEIFKKLSSGHKIVLLTITRLVETVEEKTLVMLDEPESHLHPPLLAAFIRSLSELLVLRNGVAIIATHSPVILQEVPKSCTWILSRSNISAKAERPERETFGENVGVLTHEVFGLEVSNSGFYNLIQKSVDRNEDYESVKSSFGNQLGSEAKALASVKMHLKQNRNLS